MNQKMINGMIKMRTEGFTHAQIAARYGVSERTIRRHTEGVLPQLVVSMVLAIARTLPSQKTN